MKRIPSLVLAGTHSGVGKTTISMGIMHVLSRSMKVQAFKIGPDYIDPAYHTFITGRPCRNLDGWILDGETLQRLFAKNGYQGDICIIEGVMGLYDGAGTSTEGSTAHVSRLLGAPVVLIIEGKGVAASGAAMVKGYLDYDSSVNIRGVLINNVRGENHYRLLKKAIERDTGVKVFGYLPPREGIQLPSRHLGLVPRGEIDGLKEKLDRLGEYVKATVDLQGLVQLAREQAPSFHLPESPAKESSERVSIAVAQDRAFNFYYQDNLDLLHELGADLHYFSPMKDERLPAPVHGLLIGGGFPEVFAAELEANYPLREEIGRKINEGLPVYGECGGLMYLSRGIEVERDRYFNMVGAFPATTRMTRRLQRFGYVQVDWIADNILGKKGERGRAHEFHHSVLLEEASGLEYTLRVNKERDGEMLVSWSCGITRGNMLATYSHFHFYGNPFIAPSLLARCRTFKKKNPLG